MKPKRYERFNFRSHWEAVIDTARTNKSATMEEFNNIVIAVFTVVLAGATIVLARYTKQLVAVTREMVRFQEREKRRADLKRGLDLIELLRNVDEEEFAKQLTTPGEIPEPISTQIRELNLLSRYIGDADTKLKLKQLVQWLDNVQQGSSISGNGPAIARLFKNVKERLGWSITEWRDELIA